MTSLGENYLKISVSTLTSFERNKMSNNRYHLQVKKALPTKVVHLTSS